MNPDAEYVVVRTEKDEYLLVMSDRVSSLASLFNSSLPVVLSHLSGLSIQGSTYSHPLFNTMHTFIAGRHVTHDTGTGVVHTAPAHGLDDFNICVYHNIVAIPDVKNDGHVGDIPRVSLPSSVPVYSLREDVDENGCYLDVWNERINGCNVLTEGNQRVVKPLCLCEIDGLAAGNPSFVQQTNHHSSLSL